MSSLEPADVTPRLLDVFCKHTNIMPHFHLSLQSGSDAVLKKMCRQYNTTQIRETVGLINSRLDRPAITTDIIVGFPGETEADFKQTVHLAEEAGFTKMHVFRFSPRKGTAAVKMPHRVDNQVIKRRSEILRELDIELGQKFRRQFIGESANILIEKACPERSRMDRNGIPHGRSERYFMVNIEQIKSQIKNQPCIFNNDLVKVRLVKNNKTSMTGQLLTKLENSMQRK